MILTSQINLNHLVFCGRFTLFESLFPLEIKLLSPGFNIKHFNSLFVLQSIDWGHIDGEILEKHPYINTRTHSDEDAERNGIDSLSLDWKGVWGVIYSNPLVFYHSYLPTSLLARNFVESRVILFRTSNLSHAVGCTPFFASYGVSVMHNGKFVGVLSLNLNLWLQTFVVGPYRILSAIDSFWMEGPQRQTLLHTLQVYLSCLV